MLLQTKFVNNSDKKLFTSNILNQKCEITWKQAIITYYYQLQPLSHVLKTQLLVKEYRKRMPCKWGTFTLIFVWVSVTVTVAQWYQPRVKAYWRRTRWSHPKTSRPVVDLKQDNLNFPLRYPVVQLKNHNQIVLLDMFLQNCWFHDIQS